MVHVLDTTHTATTRCGIKRKDPEALPLVLARWVSMHIVGHNMEVCPTCEREGAA